MTGNLDRGAVAGWLLILGAFLILVLVLAVIVALLAAT